MTPVRIIVPGTPKAWQRPGSKGQHRFTQRDDKAAKEAIALRARGVLRVPITLPVAVEVTFYRARLPSARPDVDNYSKLVLDALNGVVWVDDSQVVDLRAIKRVADEQGERTEIVVREAGA